MFDRACDAICLWYSMIHKKRLTLTKQIRTSRTWAIYLKQIFSAVCVLYPLSLCERARAWYDVIYIFCIFFWCISFICARGLAVLFCGEISHDKFSRRLNQKKWDKSEKLTVNYCHSFILQKISIFHGIQKLFVFFVFWVSWFALHRASKSQCIAWQRWKSFGYLFPNY